MEHINSKRREAKTSLGFTIIELLIVILIIGIIAAITIPQLLGGKRAIDQKLAVSQLADFKRAESQYKDDLNIGRFATLRELRNAAPGGNALIDPLIVDESGLGRDYKGWVIEELQRPTVSSFALKLTPVEGNPADYSFFMYEDGVVRRTDRNGPWARGTGTIVEN